MAALAAGWQLDHVIERAADDDLVTRSPAARRYLGWPMVLALRFH